MSTASGFAWLSTSDSAAPVSASHSTFDPNTIGHPVVRNPAQLRLHPALDEIGEICVEELNAAARLKNVSLSEPISITPSGTILAGIGAWQLALFEQKQEVQCIEYRVAEDDILSCMLTRYWPRHRWNAFVRIRLAQTLESALQQKALENMRAGGKYKGSTNLPKADRIDVREEIAKLAGTGSGNVTKVKTILLRANPSVVAALQKGLLKIHRAWGWCKLSKLEQRDQFAKYEEERTQRNVLREFSSRPTSVLLDASQVIKTLEETETQHPGSIAIRIGRSKRTVVILGQDLLEAATHDEGD